MRKLVVFNMISLDGFIADSHGDMSWAHKEDAQWSAFMASNATGGGELLFGRRTYEQMVSFWPTPAAVQWNPVVAERMNALPKVVFSTTLTSATWNNTRLVKSDLPGAIRRMKSETGPDLILMGSASIVSQCAQAGLIDEYQVVVSPIILGKGLSMFATVDDKRKLTLAASRQFDNGNILLTYEAA
jgi:dihydrofolate reductase